MSAAEALRAEMKAFENADPPYHPGANSATDLMLITARAADTIERLERELSQPRAVADGIEYTIVAGICKDIRSRMGFGDAWSDTDVDVRSEITSAWLNLIVDAFAQGRTKTDGYALVPIEPTMGQWDDACKVAAVPFEDFRIMYKAIVKAAPQPPVEGEGSVDIKIARHRYIAAFVDGAKWWEWTDKGATMWPEDQHKAEHAAAKKWDAPR